MCLLSSTDAAFDFLSGIQYQEYKQNELKAAILLKLVFPYEILIGAALNLKTTQNFNKNLKNQSKDSNKRRSG